MRGKTDARNLEGQETQLGDRAVLRPHMFPVLLAGRSGLVPELCEAKRHAELQEVYRFR